METLIERTRIVYNCLHALLQLISGILIQQTIFGKYLQAPGEMFPSIKGVSISSFVPKLIARSISKDIYF
jgi:hypothetical protein